MRDRRAFLSGLVGLPLVGGAVSLIGRPMAAAVPITEDLIENYRTWLHFELRSASWELAGGVPEPFKIVNRGYRLDNSAAAYHALQRGQNASARAAVVLAAVGCPLT